MATCCIFTKKGYINAMKSRKLYNRIAVLRQERGMSRKQLAEKIGVNVQTIGYLEREEYNPSLDLAFRISECFELPIKMILSPGIMTLLSEQLLQSKQFRLLMSTLKCTIFTL